MSESPEQARALARHRHLPPANVGRLTDSERVRWKELNAVVGHGIRELFKVGAALGEIRRSKLYREEFSTWEGYCAALEGLSKAHADRLVRCAKILSDLAPIRAKLPTTESQIRELGRLPKAEHRQLAWQLAVEQGDGVPLSAAKVKAVVDRMREQLGLPTSPPRPTSRDGRGSKDPREPDASVESPTSKISFDHEPATFTLADGTEFSVASWPKGLLTTADVKAKLEAMSENNRRAPEQHRKTEPVIAARQRLIISLVSVLNANAPVDSEDLRRDAVFWATEELLHLAAFLKPRSSTTLV
jgi:hypothetical protein